VFTASTTPSAGSDTARNACLELYWYIKEKKMKIALVGYGKMGHMIEAAAKRAGHEVVATIDVIAEDASVKVAAGDG